jgi:SAM-dependent methyltransferase
MHQMTVPNEQSITAEGFDRRIQSGPLESIWPRTCILRTRSELDRAVDYVSKLKLQPHIDRSKNWDSVIALETIVNSFETEAKILEVGANADAYFAVLPWLSQFGFRYLYGINTVFHETFVRKNIVYLHGDIQKTLFQERYFDAITCLFVLENGIDIERYFSESRRILTPGGLLISSVAYCGTGVEAGEKTCGGVPGRIFSRKDILNLVRLATSVGFEVIGDCGLDCEESVVHWRAADLKYTIMILTMQSKRCSASVPQRAERQDASLTCPRSSQTT